MILTVICCVIVTLAFFNAVLFLRNLRVYGRPRLPETGEELGPVSILIPARNEEAVIAAAVRAALATRGLHVEVVVLDDHSDDKTAEIVAALAAQDNRVRLASAPPLPKGWCGKQFACSVLADLARYPTLCFIDSDVRLQADGLARMVSFRDRGTAKLVSGFPFQELETFFERLLLPMMHFLLLSFLPMDSMRRYLAPSLGAGCGQLFVTDIESYRRAGGHAAIRESRHDGIALPKAYRKAKLETDLCDATDIATCRMYRSSSEVFSGLLKNATEGIAAPIRIFVFTALLGFGHVLPLPMLVYCLATRQPLLPTLLSVFALCCSYVPRLAAAQRFRQPWREALLHPIGVVVFLGLQWTARYRDLVGAPAVWKGRSYQQA